MSEFIDEEAELSSNESSIGDDDEAEIKRKKKTQKKKKVTINDDEDEEEDNSNENLEDLIDDNPVEDEEEGSEGEKRSRDSEEDDEEVDDEDYDLLEDNLGIKIKRTHKRRRVRMESDEEEDELTHDDPGRDKELIENDLFDDADAEVAASEASFSMRRDQDADDLAVSEEESEEDVNDFIVDDDDRPIVSKKMHKKRVHDDAAMQEAYELFGADISFEDLAEMEDEEEEEEDDEMEGDEEDAELVASRAAKAARKKKTKTTIYQVIEPSELERGHYTDFDQNIRLTDLPERFQLRHIPVCSTEDGELEEESEWIYRYAFATPPLSKQNYFEHERGFSAPHRKGPNVIGRIREALNLMRNQKFEVPFIAFYRKEFIDPELNIIDLWKVYHWDEKWMDLKSRKQNLLKLMERIQQFQYENISHDKPLDSNFRRLSDEDIERLKSVQSLIELKDIQQHFMLYYDKDVTMMKASIKKSETAGGEDIPEDDQEHVKYATRKSPYTLCIDAGMGEVARRFGLTPEQFGENLRDNYQQHEVEQDLAEPAELADEFKKGQFNTSDLVLMGARHVVATQIAYDPLVRSCVRTTFYERCKINVWPTKKGIKEIDEGHNCYQFKYLKNKPIHDLCEDQYLKIVQAELDGLLKIELFIDAKDNAHFTTFFEEIRQLYHRDEYSNLVQSWNTQRSIALERAMTQILYPMLAKEVKVALIDEAKECITRLCCRKLYNWLKVAPYQIDQPLDEDEDFDTTHGIRVMAIAYSMDKDESSFCAVVDGDGEVLNFLRLPHLSKRKNSYIMEERLNKEEELEHLRDFILVKKPHVVCVGSECRDVINLIEDLKLIITALEQEHQLAPISVELIDNELAKIYSVSKKAEAEMKDFPTMLRQAISLARRLQDPLIEFTQLCNSDNDLLSLRFHPLQELLNDEQLLNDLYLEFVNRVNEVGVDVSRCIDHPHTEGLIQFVCGLGPRKGYHLLKMLKQHNSRLENRTQLVTHLHVGMGPKVFINSAGFIKIDTNAVIDGTEIYVEVLDGSRIHPETYEWARKMAVDALEYDDTSEDANPAGALEEILESPDRLKDLDLDAFAEELERQGYGDKHITLYDIRAELNHRYKDLRTPYRSPTSEERFNLLTKETPQTFYNGKLLTCQVVGIARKRPQGDQLEIANPVRNDETGYWKCPFCLKQDFPELSEVWNHFDANACPGQSVGVRTRLDNGVSGFINLKNISDKHVTDPEERVKVKMVLHARIIQIDIDRFQVELTSKSSDLIDENHRWRLPYDLYYDVEAEKMDKIKDEDRKKQLSKQTYIKRVIAHPSFQNVDFQTCVKLMEKLDQGEVIIRPSSKGADHLTITWKVGEDVMQHIDVKEEEKVNAFSLGKILFIGDEPFEDLDEILARYIQPMAAIARDVINFRYFNNSVMIDVGDKMDALEAVIIAEKRQNPSKIPYYLSLSKKLPGKLVLSYMPRKTVRHEYVSITPDGLRYRQQIFTQLGAMIKWFKEHFREPIPGAQGLMMRTPGLTPAANLYVQSNQYVSNMRPPVTPQFANYTPTLAPNMTTPTPIAMTPHMTPNQPSNIRPPGLLQTPQYGMTPRNQFSNITPRQQYVTTPRMQFNNTSPQHQYPQQQDPASQDWARAAQMWAKSKEMNDIRGGTPRLRGVRTPIQQNTPLADEF